MEKFVLKKGLRAMAICTQRLHELGQTKMQPFEVLRASVSCFLMHVVTGRAADIANSRVASILVEYRHFARCIGKYRAPDVL